MTTLIRDLAYAVRSLRRTPGFTAIAVAVLGLGIGANVAVFCVANAAFLRPLPVNDPATFVRVYSNSFSNTRYSTYLELRDRNSTLSQLAAFSFRSFALRVDGDSEHAFGEIVSGNYFAVTGLPSSRGRLLTADDDRSAAPPVVVLSHAFWMRRFGGAGDVIGRTISLNGQPFTVVGIASEGFGGLLPPLVGSLWVPAASDTVLRSGASLAGESFHLTGRLRPGVRREQAQADLDTIGRQLRRARGETDTGVAVSVYGPTMMHPEISRGAAVVVGAVMAVMALVLMIVCVNVANLVLARAAGRTQEIAVRQSLGAGRGRLIRQLLTESFVLSLAGAAAGLAIAYWSSQLLMNVPLPAPMPVQLNLPVDLRVAGFSTLVAVLAVVAFGVAPALSASRVDLMSVLRRGGGESPRQGRLRTIFLVGQVAMSVLLLVIAGLAIRSARAAASIDVGFDPASVVSASLDLETRGYSPDRGRAFIQALQERLDASAAIASANFVDIVPLTLSNTTTNRLRDTNPVWVEGQPLSTPQIYVNAVSPRHFRTLGIPLLAGRDFTALDTSTSGGVAIVNETMAQRFWPGQNPIGQRLRPLNGSTSPEDVVEVVGLVRDSKYVTAGEEPRVFMYRPLTQAYVPRVTVLARGRGADADTLATLKREVGAIDNGLALFAVSPLREAISVSLLPARIVGGLLGVLGLLALTLAAIGVYGVLSFIVGARTREIGVRIAVGASPAAVIRMVMRQALTWTATGMAVGFALALVSSQLLRSFLYGVSPTDPLTFAAVIVVLSAVAALAAWLPARRASRLDPVIALRQH